MRVHIFPPWLETCLVVLHFSVQGIVQIEQILSGSGPISKSVVFITSFPVWDVSDDLVFDSDRCLRSLLGKIIYRSNLAFKWLDPQAQV